MGHAKTQSLCELACVISQLDNMCNLSKLSVLKRSVPKKEVISIIFYVARLGMNLTICHSIVHYPNKHRNDRDMIMQRFKLF